MMILTLGAVFAGASILYALGTPLNGILAYCIFFIATQILFEYWYHEEERKEIEE